MPNIPCVAKYTCECADQNPIRNLSAEAPDRPAFLATYFAAFTPPLGTNWTSTSCVAYCDSIVSQEQADLCAALAALECVAAGWLQDGGGPTNPAVPPAQNPRGHRRTPIFLNSEQVGTVACPDGLPFDFVVPSGIFGGFSPAEANAKAQSYATRQSALHQICLSDIQDIVCLADPYAATITATGSFLAQAPQADIWELTDGFLPPGLSIPQFIFDTGAVTGGAIDIIGTPELPGIYHFTITVTDPVGDFFSKPYTLTVAGITNGNSLPDAAVGTAYSADVNSVGVTNPIFSLEDGALPDGLSLDSGGIIFGTPTAGGTFDFILGVTEAGTGRTCLGLAQIVVASSINWNDLVWVTPDVPDDGSGTDPFGTFQENNFDIPFSGYFANQLNNSASMPFSGGPVNCNMQVTITALGSQYNPTGTATQIDLLIQDQASNTYFSTVGDSWLVPGVYNLPFTIPALVGATLTLTLTVACLNGNVNSIFAVTAEVTPAS